MFQVPPTVSMGRATRRISHISRSPSSQQTAFPMDLHSYFKSRLPELRPLSCRETSVVARPHNATHKVKMTALSTYLSILLLTLILFLQIHNLCKQLAVSNRDRVDHLVTSCTCRPSKCCHRAYSAVWCSIFTLQARKRTKNNLVTMRSAGCAASISFLEE